MTARVSRGPLGPPRAWGAEERHALSALTSATLYYEGCAALERHARMDLLDMRATAKRAYGIDRLDALTPHSITWYLVRVGSSAARKEWVRARDASKYAKATLEYKEAWHRERTPAVVEYLRRINGR